MDKEKHSFNLPLVLVAQSKEKANPGGFSISFIASTIPIQLLVYNSDYLKCIYTDIQF